MKGWSLVAGGLVLGAVAAWFWPVDARADRRGTNASPPLPASPGSAPGPATRLSLQREIKLHQLPAPPTSGASPEGVLAYCDQLEVIAQGPEEPHRKGRRDAARRHLEMADRLFEDCRDEVRRIREERRARTTAPPREPVKPPVAAGDSLPSVAVDEPVHQP